MALKYPPKTSLWQTLTYSITAKPFATRQIFCSMAKNLHPIGKMGKKIEKSRNRQVEIHSFSKLLATAAGVTANQSYLAFSTIVASLLLFYLSFKDI